MNGVWTGLGVLAIAYLGLAFALWAGQTRLMFFPSPVLESTPDDRQLTYEEAWIPINPTQENGEMLYGWWIPAPRPDAPVVLDLHGNGSNIGDRVYRAERLHRWGYGVLLFDYRGYGRSVGSFPHEAQVYEDAEAAWRYLTETRQIAPDSIVIYGESIGGAIALYLASRHPEAAGVIIESSFTSMSDMVRYRFPVQLVPMEILLNQQFDSLSRVRSLQMPILLIHGLEDDIVPVTMSQVLYEAAPEPKSLVLIPGAGHNDLSIRGGTDYFQAIQRFINQHATP